MRFSLRELIFAVVAAGALVGYKVDHWYMNSQLEEAQKRIELLNLNNSVIIGSGSALGTSSGSVLLPNNSTRWFTGSTTWSANSVTTNGNVYIGY